MCEGDRDDWWGWNRRGKARLWSTVMRWREGDEENDDEDDDETEEKREGVVVEE